MTKYWLGKTRDKTMWNRDDWIKYYQDKITGSAGLSYGLFSEVF